MKFAAQTCANCGAPKAVGLCTNVMCQNRNGPSVATVEWERFDYENGETIWQRKCPTVDPTRAPVAEDRSAATRRA